MGEQQDGRAKIDNYVRHLIANDRSLAKNPERAVEIAKGAQIRSEGGHRPVEGQKKR